LLKSANKADKNIKDQYKDIKPDGVYVKRQPHSRFIRSEVLNKFKKEEDTLYDMFGNLKPNKAAIGINPNYTKMQAAEGEWGASHKELLEHYLRTQERLP
jgi:hypothetical protein